MVRYASDLEVNIISVERTNNYLALPSEATWEKEDIKAASSDSLSDVSSFDNQVAVHWPSQGVVSFENYSTRYREGLELTLHDICFTTKASEKVGIVGRTGAGKSSVALALFRIIEPVAGRIMVDGVDITQLGLKKLRSRLSIIPQDPVLFSGTIRFNLDPSAVRSDCDIWNALEVAHLKTFIERREDGLNFAVEEGGSNLSGGQRQLVCLARALLRKSKILVLDEATSAVDMETDALIQETIQTEFKDCTILTIAHRLNTIMEYDRILVLDEGRIAEFDTPKNLLDIEDGLFYRMVNDAGLVGTDTDVDTRQ